MTDGREPGIWLQLLDSVPPAIRYVLAALSLAVLTLVGAMWTRYERQLKRVQDDVDATRSHHDADVIRLYDRIERSEQRLLAKLDDVNRNLITIARNTRHRTDED